MMTKLIIIMLIFAIAICACEKKESSDATAPVAKSPDTVEGQPSNEGTTTDITDVPEVSEENTVAIANAQGTKKEELIAGLFDGGSIEMPSPGVISKYDKIIRKYARRYLFDWRLISAQIYAESRFLPTAKSAVGALGLMQIMPGTARWLEEKSAKDTEEFRGASALLLDPEVNINLGCYYDAMLFSKIENAENNEARHKIMFAAYNAGPGNLSKAQKTSPSPGNWEGVKPYLPKETQRYIPKIYDKYEIYKQWAVLIPY